MDSFIAHATSNQAARAATVTWAALLFRRMIERQEMKPVSFPNMIFQISFFAFRYN